MDSQNVVKINVAGDKNHSVSPENATNDAEISIFEAHKYFSEECNDIKRQQQGGIKPSHDFPCAQRVSSVASAEGSGRNFRSKSSKASSEASWNSQTSLLSNPLGSTGVSLKDHASICRSRRWSAAKKWFLKRNCCCSCEKSVPVKEKREPIVVIDTMKSSNRKSNKDQRRSMTDNVVEIHHIKAMAPNTSTASSSSSSMDAPRQQRISATGRPFIEGTVGFTFPILTSPPGVKAIVAKSTVNPLEDTVMEGFLQAVPSPTSRPSSMEINHVNARGPSSPIVREDDVGSDVSSDLFEIETCPMHSWWESVDENSNSATSLVFENGITDVQHCRRSVDEEVMTAAPTLAETECYQLKAISEASGACSRPPREEVGGNNGSMQMSCREEKMVAEGPPLLVVVPVGRRSPRGSSPSSPFDGILKIFL